MNSGFFFWSVLGGGRPAVATTPPGTIRRPLLKGAVRVIGAGLNRFLSVARAPHWETTGPGLERRAYAGYQAYLKHQQSKLSLMADLSVYEARFATALRERLIESGRIAKGMRVLCLGARLGSEVKVFQELGCFAVGIDLNPGPRNPSVLHGDFHTLTFPSESTDLVFSNSFDHVLDPDRVVDEIERVLVSGGVLVLEAVRGRAEGQKPGLYESFFWSTIDDLVALVQGHAFRLLSRRPFSDPWAGEQLCFSTTG